MVPESLSTVNSDRQSVQFNPDIVIIKKNHMKVEHRNNCVYSPKIMRRLQKI